MDDDKVQQLCLNTVLNQEAYILLYISTNIANKLSDLNTYAINSIQIDLPTIAEIKDAQRKDEKLLEIIFSLENPHQSNIHNYDDYFLKDGLLMHKAFIPRIRRTTKV